MTKQEVLDQIEREFKYAANQQAGANFIASHAERLEKAEYFFLFTGYDYFQVEVFIQDRKEAREVRAFFHQTLQHKDAGPWGKQLTDSGARYRKEFYDKDGNGCLMTVVTGLPPTCHVEYEEITSPARTYKRAVVKCDNAEMEATV